MSLKLSTVTAAIAMVVTTAPSIAQDGRFHVVAGKLQQRTNGVLALMGYSQTPDVTSGALAIKNGSTGNPSFDNTSLGGGFTVSDSVPSTSRERSATPATIRSSLSRTARKHGGCRPDGTA